MMRNRTSRPFLQAIQLVFKRSPKQLLVGVWIIDNRMNRMKLQESMDYLFMNFGTDNKLTRILGAHKTLFNIVCSLFCRDSPRWWWNALLSTAEQLVGLKIGTSIFGHR